MKHITSALFLSLLVALAARAQDTVASYSGKVIETTNASTYTYILVDTGTAKKWAAAPQFAVKVGDRVTVPGGVAMTKFHSQTLKRDFDEVCFTGAVTVDGAAGANASASTGKDAAQLPPGHPPLTGATGGKLPPGHPAINASATAPNLDLTGIKPSAGGKTIAEIYAAATKLSGQSIVVRGKVVKYNSMILNKNWLHIQDGTGSAEHQDNDLTVTTATAAKLGDTVLVTGKISTDKDFGAGYKYHVILDDAQVTVE